MEEKYQLVNPNNARIKIDYTKKEGEKATFEYVGKQKISSIVRGFVFRYFVLIAILWGMVSLGLMSLEEGGYLVSGSYKGIMVGVILTLAFLFYFTIPIILSKSQKFLKIFPDLQFKKSEHYEALFFPKDVRGYEVEIPLFDNVGLDYCAIKDFSRYLTNVEIIEHPFTYVVKKKRSQNEYIWKATFYFSKKPQNGFLKVRFT